MRKQIFIDDVHEYDYELVDDNRHTLYYSNGAGWQEYIRGNVAMQIIDTGNGLHTNLHKTINYSEAQELFILLKLINQPSKYEISTKKLL